MSVSWQAVAVFAVAGAVDRDGVDRGAARRRSATEDNDEAMMCVRCEAG